MVSISRRRFGVAAAGAAFAAAAGGAQRVVPTPPNECNTNTDAPVFGAKRHILKAKAIDQTYAIDVMPVISALAPPRSVTSLPVVFVLDGNLEFPLVASTAFIFSLGIIPSVLVVGIGYDIAAPAGSPPWLGEINARRTRDYSPSIDKMILESQEATYKQYGARYPAYGMPGGARAFLSFINDELKPFISAHYPMADLANAAIVGDSLGGLFTLYALFTAPKSFRRYVAASPTVFWDNQMIFKLMPKLGNAQASLFMSVGAAEPEEKMVAPVKKMDALIKRGNHPDLQYVFQVFEGEDHGTVVPIALSRGLHEVFPKPTGLRPLFSEPTRSGRRAPDGAHR